MLRTDKLHQKQTEMRSQPQHVAKAAHPRRNGRHAAALSARSLAEPDARALSPYRSVLACTSSVAKARGAA